MLSLIQNLYAKFSIFKFDFFRKFGEAIVILKYRKETGDFPHGDEEYEKVLREKGW